MSLRGTNSDMSFVKHGVPQGSILGPVLFIIYVNDLVHCVDGVKFTVYADDTTVTTSNTSFEGLVGSLCDARLGVGDWFASNQLSLNVAKSGTIIFSLNNSYTEDKSVKFLGVMLDPKLNWNPQVDFISAKIAKNVHLLRNIKRLVSDRVMMMAYYGTIDCHLRYAILSWGHAPAAMRLFKLQRRAVRVVAGIGWRTPCRDIFIKYKILTLPCLFMLECLKYTRSNMSKFSIQSDIHNYETRNEGNVLVPYHRLKCTRTGTNYYGPRIFNKLPSHVKSLDFDRFSSVLTNFFAAKAYYSLNEYFEDRLSNMLI